MIGDVLSCRFGKDVSQAWFWDITPIISSSSEDLSAEFAWQCLDSLECIRLEQGASGARPAPPLLRRGMEDVLDAVRLGHGSSSAITVDFDLNNTSSGPLLAQVNVNRVRGSLILANSTTPQSRCTDTTEATQRPSFMSYPSSPDLHDTCG
ncbi:hypothetical protein BD410DRAFT_847313 [Rickenella mellea]|uniref:Uncharacterized protein n=1 Tax=Rickenella mellea TaxID=50990 RepID=A0A4Y7PCY2_9AGAM|nr:hypothetical protein BD410DRAFT_847313 [Rickenella mellea]